MAGATLEFNSSRVLQAINAAADALGDPQSMLETWGSTY